MYHTHICLVLFKLFCHFAFKEWCSKNLFEYLTLTQSLQRDNTLSHTVIHSSLCRPVNPSLHPSIRGQLKAHFKRDGAQSWQELWLKQEFKENKVIDQVHQQTHVGLGSQLFHLSLCLLWGEASNTGWSTLALWEFFEGVVKMIRLKEESVIRLKEESLNTNVLANSQQLNILE